MGVGQRQLPITWANDGDLYTAYGDAKASGMLMLGGVLYAWVRNGGNSQLIWSADHAKTWHWGFRLRTSFGLPSLLNFGCNYAGARDEYVYTYSQDGPGTYTTDARLVLVRFPNNRIRNRSAYGVVR